jgi:putative restriction endonuclease
MASGDFDVRLRAAMFAYLDQISDHGVQEVSTSDLNAFAFEGRRISLLQHMRGIRVLSGLPGALTIRTTFARRPEDRPYEDIQGEDKYFRYKWQGDNPEAHDNVALRAAMTEGKPIAWFVGVAPGQFVAVYPVWLVGEEAVQKQFVVAFDDVTRADWATDARLKHPADMALRSQYVESVVRRRLHQPVFRQRVLRAYESQCAMCRLRHRELLDAAHIREDADGGEPIVPNAVAMCAIHHRAFDNHVVGIRPDFVIQVRPDVLSESDGPTLKHALQGIHGTKIVLPRNTAARPNIQLLEDRFKRFRLAS